MSGWVILGGLAAMLIGAVLAVSSLKISRRKADEPIFSLTIVLGPGHEITYEWPRR